MQIILLRKCNKKLNWLTEFSDVGVARNELSEGLRSIPYNRYALYYRVDQTTLELARVMHSARDIDLIFC